MGIQQMVLGADAGIGAALDDSYNADAVDEDPANATAGFKLLASGAIQGTSSPDGNAYINLGTWLLSGAASEYEARVTMVTGTLTGGTTGSWLALSSDRTWTKTRTSFGYIACTFTVEIRRVSDSVVLDSSTVVLEAEVF